MKKTSSEFLQQSVEIAQPSGIARRRILRAGLAAPVVLAVSGRSAMAGTCPTLLSPAAWNSLAPQGGDCNIPSHTVNRNAPGKSPGFWAPNGSLYHQNQSATFQGPWPVGIDPFITITFPTHHGDKTVTWDRSQWDTYKGLPLKNDGWGGGTKFSAIFTKSSDPRSFSQILINDTASDGCNWHLCAAYLNALTFSTTYAMSTAEVLEAYDGKIGNRTGLDCSQVRAFLDQTWE
jgi:hypothetical protein